MYGQPCKEAGLTNPELLTWAVGIPNLLGRVWPISFVFMRAQFHQKRRTPEDIRMSGNSRRLLEESCRMARDENRRLKNRRRRARRPRVDGSPLPRGGIIALVATDKYGRRPLLLLSFGGAVKVELVRFTPGSRCVWLHTQ